jgi:hypothetical protein
MPFCFKQILLFPLVPQRLKPLNSMTLAARLKAAPFQKAALKTHPVSSPALKPVGPTAIRPPRRFVLSTTVRPSCGIRRRGRGRAGRG